MLGVAGLAVLLAGTVADLVYLALLPRSCARATGASRGPSSPGASLGFLVLHVLGLALLIAALLGTARPDHPWAQPPAPQFDPPAQFGSPAPQLNPPAPRLDPPAARIDPPAEPG